MLLVSSNSFVSDSDLNKILPIQFKKEQKALKETEGGPFKCFCCCCCFFNLFLLLLLLLILFLRLSMILHGLLKCMQKKA